MIKRNHILCYDKGLGVEISDRKTGFHHRIFKVVGETTHYGEWATFAGITTVKVNNCIYAHATSYYEGIFPIEVPFKVKAFEII